MLMITPPKKNINSSRFRRGKQILREEGFFCFLKRILLFLRSLLFVYECCYLYEKRLDRSGQIPSIPCKVANLTIRVIACLEEFGRLLADGFDPSPYEMDIQQCKKRLSRGAIFFCAFIDKKLAHGSWVSMDKRTHNELYHFSIDYRDTASVGGTYTSPKYRGRGIYPYIYVQIFQYLREKGRSRAVLEVHNDNVVAQRAQAMLGADVWGEGHYLELLSMFKFRWTKLKSGSVSAR